MLTKTQEQILAFLLSRPEEQFTIRGIAKKLAKSYTLVYNNIGDLEKKDIIKKQRVPPGQIIKLNEYAPTNVFVDIELKRKEELLKQIPWIEVMLGDILETVKNIFFILLVFGSYAKGNQTVKSDIDLLIIVKDKKEIKEIDEAVYKVYTPVKKGLNFVDVNDFREMVINPNTLNVCNEARKYHIILYGTELYYQLLNGIRK